MAQSRRRAAALAGPRCRSHPSPLRRLEPVLRVGARPVDDLHLRRASPPPTPRWSRRRSTSTTWCARSSRSSRASGCSMSAAAGAGWSDMPSRNYGVTALGVTLSAEQAAWASVKIKELDLQDRAEVRHLDYRDVTEGGFDAISSIGLTEHIGVANYPAYFGFLRDKLKPQGRLLNHCITRQTNRLTRTGPFIDRYVFPDAELTGSGRSSPLCRTRFGSPARGEPPDALRDDAAPDGTATSSRTGTSASPRWARAPRGSGACTLPGPGWGSKPTSSSCTRCWPRRRQLTEPAPSRCGPTGRRDVSRPAKLGRDRQRPVCPAGPIRRRARR